MKAIKSIKRLLFPIFRFFYINHYLLPLSRFKIEKYLSKLRKKDVINVIFLPMNVAMWKYQNLYNLLKKDPRFNVYIFLSPNNQLEKSAKCEDLKKMRDYFGSLNIEYVDYELEKEKPIVKITSVVEPDILFYTQPYLTVYEKKHRYLHFTNKLLCYAPYGFCLRIGDIFFNTDYTNLCWKYYHHTIENIHNYKKTARNKGCNAVLSGYLSADEFITKEYEDVWKRSTNGLKKIIWAPHFTIVKNLGYFHASFFLEMAEYMRKLAVVYSDKVAFAFKPHPRLFSELCKHPEWGPHRTKEYYDFWKNSHNTQLETGDFINLFRGSDAMIHDSGSFVVDYLYFKKPVLYDNPNIESVKTTADKNGIKAYDLHYKVRQLDDIVKFIEDVVIGGNDYLYEQRKDFYNKVLKSPNNKMAAQNIYDDLVNSIWGNK